MMCIDTKQWKRKELSLRGSFQNSYLLVQPAAMVFARKRPLSATLSIILLISLLYEIYCEGMQNQTCNHGSSSSGGSTPEIRCPFWLQTDALNCGEPGYEVVCENNHTVIDLVGRKYYVEEIFYDNFSMRVVDPGIHRHDFSSLPLHPRTPYSYTQKLDAYTNEGIAFVSCPVGVEVNSTIFVDIAPPCDISGASFPSASSPLPTRSYFVRGGLKVSDVKDSCVIGMQTLVSNHWLHINSTDFQSIHDGMAYGFELLWFRSHPNCTECKGKRGFCYLRKDNTVGCTYAVTFFCHSLHWECIRSWLEVIGWCLLVYGVPAVLGSRLAIALLCGFPCTAIFLIRKWGRRHLSIYNAIEEFLQGENNFMPIRYSYSQLRKMTRDFKDKVGEGGYGCVYKGKLRSGSHVAVKMLGNSNANGQDFMNEVATIGRIHHANVVRLIGFCVENSKRALVYDFLPNGSLEKHIFSNQGSVSISWDKMHDISLGVASGIQYLHRGCGLQILHFDIKPHNILLDQNLAPQISDFGLAKLCPADTSIVSLTGARGTMGYMAPELFYKNLGAVSNKADVYSFGMMLMEMAARRKNLNAFAESLSQIYFPLWVYDQLSEGKDLGIGDQPEERNTILKMIIVALWCIQMKPTDRPSMNRVLEMLEGSVENLQMPPRPFTSPREIPNPPIHA